MLRILKECISNDAVVSRGLLIHEDSEVHKAAEPSKAKHLWRGLERDDGALDLWRLLTWSETAELCICGVVNGEMSSLALVEVQNAYLELDSGDQNKYKYNSLFV